MFLANVPKGWVSHQLLFRSEICALTVEVDLEHVVALVAVWFSNLRLEVQAGDSHVQRLWIELYLLDGVEVGVARFVAVLEGRPPWDLCFW